MGEAGDGFASPRTNLLVQIYPGGELINSEPTTIKLATVAVVEVGEAIRRKGDGRRLDQGRRLSCQARTSRWVPT